MKRKSHKLPTIGDENVEIQWMKGSYSTPFTVCKLGRGGICKEKIPQNAILFHMELTRASRIGSNLKEKQKDAFKKFT